MFLLTFCAANGALPYVIQLNMASFCKLFLYAVLTNFNYSSSTDKSQKPVASEWVILLHVLLHLLCGAGRVDVTDLYSASNTHTCFPSAIAAGTTSILHHGRAYHFVLPSLHFVCHLCFLYF
jgi:hypothetical protein